MLITKSYLNKLTYKVIGSIIEVHKIMGKGLAESVYHRCLEHEFYIRQIKYKSEFDIDVTYKGVPM